MRPAHRHPRLPTPPTEGGGVGAGTVRLLSLAAGLGVSTIYLAQPLLPRIAAEFDTGDAATGALVTATTAGYALGLVLVVPLADVLRRRRLVVRLLTVVAAGQVLCAFAPGLAVLTALSFAVAGCSVVAPVLVALGAALAAPEQRGRVTGSVVSGVLVGLLLARVGSGLLAALVGGWRPVFVVSAALIAILAAVLGRTLPDLPPASSQPYPALLRSVLTVLRGSPVLQRRCLYGFFGFAGFSALWTCVAFLLAGPPYGLGEAAAGLLGLVGALGALSARVVGHLADRGRERRTTAGLLLVVLTSWGLMALGGIGDHRLLGLVALVAGVALLDLGVQGLHVANLSVVYRDRPEARNRVTTAYTATYFAGGVCGSAAAGAAWQAGGWAGVCAVGALLALAPLAVHLGTGTPAPRAGSGPQE